MYFEANLLKTAMTIKNLSSHVPLAKGGEGVVFLFPTEEPELCYQPEFLKRERFAALQGTGWELFFFFFFIFFFFFFFFLFFPPEEEKLGIAPTFSMTGGGGT